MSSKRPLSTPPASSKEPRQSKIIPRGKGRVFCAWPVLRPGHSFLVTGTSRLRLWFALRRMRRKGHEFHVERQEGGLRVWMLK